MCTRNWRSTPSEKIGGNWLKLGHHPRRFWASNRCGWCIRFFYLLSVHAPSRLGVQNRRGASILFPMRAFTLALFRLLLFHFSTSICTSFYSILLPVVRDVESFDLNGSIFDFKSVRALFPLKLCTHSFSSIFICFYWYCYCIEHLFVLCGFGRVRLADLGSFVLLVLASPLSYKRCVFIFFEKGAK